MMIAMFHCDPEWKGTSSARRKKDKTIHEVSNWKRRILFLSTLFSIKETYDTCNWYSITWLKKLITIKVHQSVISTHSNMLLIMSISKQKFRQNFISTFVFISSKRRLPTETLLKNSGAQRDRTSNLWSKALSLFQLSYTGWCRRI